MFKCFVTNRMSKPGEKVNKIVVKTRDKIYYAWFRNEETGKFEQVEIGRGNEIVSEVNASDEGLRLWTQANAK